MKLDYSILWFEDDRESVNDIIVALDEELKNQGFILKTDFGPCNPNDMEKMVKKLYAYNPYDLMVFDYNLGDEVKGEDLAQILRKQIWTEIVYYSSNRKFNLLSQGMVTNNVQGVFCSTRQYLASNIWNIIESQIKRICDINNMRGIVLDAMSEIDYAMRAFLSVHCQNLNNDEQKKFANKISKKINERIKDATNYKEKLDENNYEVVTAVYNYNYVDFEFIRNRLSKINDYFENESSLHELQTLRNKLAHQPSKFNAGKIELIDQKTKESETFDYTRFQDIRKKLIDIYKKLIELGIFK